MPGDPETKKKKKKKNKSQKEEKKTKGKKKNTTRPTHHRTTLGMTKGGKSVNRGFKGVEELIRRESERKSVPISDV